MKQEDIDHAASVYACEWYSISHDNGVARGAFIDGAKWALKHQWISVDDRLPENGVCVFAIDSDDGYVAWYDEKTNTFYDDSDHAIVPTYWMEMPEL